MTQGRAVCWALTLGLLVGGGMPAGGAPRSKADAAIDFAAFLARHDLIWKRLPGKWE
jgi:hypothetical protein